MSKYSSVESELALLKLPPVNDKKLATFHRVWICVVGIFALLCKMYDMGNYNRCNDYDDSFIILHIVQS